MANKLMFDRMGSLAATIAVIALLTSCTSQPESAEGRAPDSTKIIADIIYVPHRPLHCKKLDLPLPAAQNPGKSAPLPLVVWIHGGAWKYGDKTPAPATALIEHGYAVASLNYRLIQEAPFPAQIFD